jgi:hypothetical protein
MKVKMIKHAMTRWCQESEVELLISAGWRQADAEIKTVEEPIVLKPPVKSKGTAKSLDNANQQGDE